MKKDLEAPTFPPQEGRGNGPSGPGRNLGLRAALLPFNSKKTRAEPFRLDPTVAALLPPSGGSTVCFFWFLFFATDRGGMKVSVHLCVSKTQRALSLMQLRDDKSSCADAERQHQETSPSQGQGGASRRSSGEGGRELLNFRVVFLTTSATLLSNGTPNSPVCQLSADLRQLSGHVSVASSPK